jgi:hypothetical protein
VHETGARYRAPATALRKAHDFICSWEHFCVGSEGGHFEERVTATQEGLSVSKYGPACLRMIELIRSGLTDIQSLVYGRELGRFIAWLHRG